MGNKIVAAKFVSALTNPALVLLAAMLVLVWRYADNQGEFWRWAVAGTALLIAPGVLYAAIIWRKEKAVDIDLSNRQDRVVPLVLASLGALIGGYLLRERNIDERLVTVSYIFVAVVMALTIITLVWKISLHATTLSALVSLLVFFRSDSFVYGYLLLLPIAWARLTLKQHTPAQIIGGALVGSLMTLILGAFFSSRQ